jgi:hypothetical protein
MIPGLLARARLPAQPGPDSGPATRRLRIAIWLLVGALCALKFFYLTADFPNYSPWMIDQAKFTDEGWWGSAAVMHALTGHWYVAGDYNPAVALPVWPLLLSFVFHFTGVSVVAARALNVTLSIATLGIVYALVRRYSRPGAETPAMLAALLLALSPFAFVFNRLAILETPVVFEFCLLMLVASFASARRIWPLAALAVLIPIMLLTKTTAAVAIPAIFWLAWTAMGRTRAALLSVVLAVAVVPAGLLKGYAALAAALGYGGDYRYFFSTNAMPDIDWRQTIPTLAELLRNCFWIDRVLYPVALVILVLTVAWKRKLWRNPLFAAAWMAIGADACFIFSRQDDYAPRYFLLMLAPLVWIVVLTLNEVFPSSRKAAALLLLAIAVSAAANAAMIAQFLFHREYQFCDAANSIRKIIQSDPAQNELILGVSGSQISLMTGIRSINDGYGTEDMAEKVARYQPGWYLAWNQIAAEDSAALAPYRLEKAASYPVFDDDERNLLILYRMVRCTANSPGQPQAAAAERSRY